jgi:hypothetical protein
MNGSAPTISSERTSLRALRKLDSNSVSAAAFMNSRRKRRSSTSTATLKPSTTRR